MYGEEDNNTNEKVMYGEEEKNINEKGQKIPFAHTQAYVGDDDLKREPLGEDDKKYAQSTLEKTQRIASLNEAANLYRNASPSERTKIENEIISLYDNAADIINMLREESHNYDLANSIKEKIDKKLK